MLCKPVEPLVESNCQEVFEYLQVSRASAAAEKAQKDWHKPLFPGCKSTLIQAVYERVHSQMYGKTRDGASNIDCRAHHELYQPQGSLFPRSRHLMLKVCMQCSSALHDCLAQALHYSALHGSATVCVHGCATHFVQCSMHNRVCLCCAMLIMFNTCRVLAAQGFSNAAASC